jgi:hypothetical protein
LGIILPHAVPFSSEALARVGSSVIGSPVSRGDGVNSLFESWLWLQLRISQEGRKTTADHEGFSLAWVCLDGSAQRSSGTSPPPFKLAPKVIEVKSKSTGRSLSLTRTVCWTCKNGTWLGHRAFCANTVVQSIYPTFENSSRKETRGLRLRHVLCDRTGFVLDRATMTPKMTS